MGPAAIAATVRAATPAPTIAVHALAHLRRARRLCRRTHAALTRSGTVCAAGGQADASNAPGTPPPSRRLQPKEKGNLEGGSGSFSRKRAGGDLVRVKKPDAAFRAGNSPLSSVTTSVSRALLGSSEQTLMLSIKGMTCAACVGAVERALVEVAGVREVSISLMGKRGQIFYAPDVVEPPTLIHAVTSIGYEAVSGAALAQCRSTPPRPRLRDVGRHLDPASARPLVS